VRELESPAKRRHPIEWPDQPGHGHLELIVMNYCGWTTVVVVTGFVFYRFFTGDLQGALTNAVIVALLTGVLLAGRVPRLRQAALVAFGLIITAACLMSALLVSPNGLLWAFLVLWINFLVLPRVVAAVFNLSVTFILAAHTELFDSVLEQISWVTVALLISTFSFFFTRQLREQRRMLSELATLDPLTGAGNRRLLRHDMETAIAQKHRGRRPSTLVVMDLDHFKRINDNHGHEAGDQLLERFVQTVRAALRTEDGLYRMGGEEFVLLLHDMDRETAETSLEDLHRRLSGRVETPDGALMFSAGAAVLQPGENWSQWLARADRALYQAKNGGRNRLVIA